MASVVQCVGAQWLFVSPAPMAWMMMGDRGRCRSLDGTPVRATRKVRAPHFSKERLRGRRLDV
jgi:hypothetical protein